MEAGALIQVYLFPNERLSQEKEFYFSKYILLSLEWYWKYDIYIYIISQKPVKNRKYSWWVSGGCNWWDAQGHRFDANKKGFGLWSQYPSGMAILSFLNSNLFQSLYI